MKAEKLTLLLLSIGYLLTIPIVVYGYFNYNLYTNSLYMCSFPILLVIVWIFSLLPKSKKGKSQTIKFENRVLIYEDFNEDTIWCIFYSNNTYYIDVLTAVRGKHRIVFTGKFNEVNTEYDLRYRNLEKTT